jgi:adenylosuccinate synthase
VSAPRLVSLLGLGFGDCGKGLFTDALCRRWSAHSVVRFNGGAQAGHNVVLPDGRHHTFSQFGAGTLVPGVATVLAAPVVVHPTALLVEEARLRSIGVSDALARQHIDRRCRINTPFHQAAGRLRELRRGNSAHGTCGVGVGETVRHALQHPDQVLHYGDLARPALAMQKLEAIRHSLLAEFAETPESAGGPAIAEYQLLADEQAAERWLAATIPLLRQVAPTSPEQLAAHLGQPGTVLFEGAQGVLLDEWHGFHPHTTWSSITPTAVEAVAADYGLGPRIEHLGILRAYLTRHGQGPLPTADAALGHLPEPHNDDQGWQGEFRRGHPDGVLLRYALAVVGQLDGLLVSHLDVFARGTSLRWCEAYQAPRANNDTLLCHRSAALIDELRCGPPRDLNRQAALNQLLSTVTPIYDTTPISSATALLERLTALAQCPVILGAHGPTHRDTRGSREKEISLPA